jgi:cell division protein ZapD
VIRYEHPLNERIRTLMRLEDLYRRAQFFASQSDAPDHHAALSVLFEITDVAARADLKTDLLQELERQKQLLLPLRNNPAIESRVLEALLADIDRASGALLAHTGKAGVHLRDNEWLMTIKQRTSIPDLRRARDRAAHPARQRPGEPPDRARRRVPADADDDKGRAAPAPDRSA